MTAAAPAILPNVDRDAYDQIAAINWSTLRYIEISAHLLNFRQQHPRKDTPALYRGRALHCALFEPERFFGEYAFEPDFGDCRFRENKVRRDAWREEHADRELLPAAEYDLVQRVASAVYEHRVARAFLVGGRPEETITWTDPVTGLLCKARLDYVRPTEIVDVKGTRRQTVREFRRDLSSFLYYGQMAWYHDGARAAGVLPPDAERPVVIAPQTVEPFDVMAFRLTEHALESGRRLWRSLLDRYATCREANWWPGIAPDLIDLDVDPWAAGANDYEPEGDDWI
jgi:exodeoxyribonuclease VIII